MMPKEDAKKLFYNIGDFIWRRQDNALFEVAQIIYSGDLDQYELICVNGVGDNTHASCVKLSVDHTIFTPIAPSDLKLNQHIWNKATGIEYIVKDVFPGETPKHPCHNCHDGKCEQCKYGYKSDAQIMSMIGNKSSDTKYRIESLDHKRSYDIDNNVLKEDSEFTIYPPHKVGLTSDDEAEKVMNERLEAESVATGETIENDSYTRWRDGLKVVNVPKFDLNYFIKGLAYHVNKVTNCYPGEFYGIMVETSEDVLKIMKLGNNIHFESTEIIEIPLKEYLNGDWHVVRLVEEV